MRLAVALFALSSAVIAVVWAWLGAPIDMPHSPLDAGEKLYCVSYAPFRAGQNPWGAANVEPWQIDEDLGRLKRLTDCVRSYSVDHGLDKIPEIAQRHGMTVIQGLWLSSLPDLSRQQIETTVALAQRYPGVIRAIVVGNEVLLRGEMAAPQLLDIIHEVKARVPNIPVTYADVWEFWLRNQELAAAVDFVTIHLLPYWEDFPIPVRDAAAHADAIRARVAAAFPNKEVLIGEVGWPSAGRMREGALPSPANQARMLHDVLSLAKAGNYHVNVIEAFDQPWKRQLEGTVGGHWGLFDADRRNAKFAWGAPVSNHPDWELQAAAGILLAGLTFAGAAMAARRKQAAPTLSRWSGVAGMAIASGTLIGWTIENIPQESLYLGDWVRTVTWALAAAVAPVVCAIMLTSGGAVPSFGQILSRRFGRAATPWAVGIVFLLLTILAIQAALGLVFDPRYRDFPFAPLTGAVVPFLIVTGPSLRIGKLRKPWGPASETVAAGVLGLSAVYIAFNESLANWQAIWFAAGLIILATLLQQVRAAPD